MKQFVSNYELLVDIPPGQYHFTGNSVGNKPVVKQVFSNNNLPRSVLDIGFGVGDLGRIIKTDSATHDWVVDGVDGFRDTCCNRGLFEKRYYRNIWHGLAQELPAAQLQAYDLICLFDVIEHLDGTSATALLHSLLESLGPNSRLVLSTPLWFWPQAHTNPGDLEEHVIAIPSSSLLRLQPLMFTVNSKFLVGTFVFSRRSLAQLTHFRPTVDKGFDLAAGLRDLEAMGQRADDVLYIAPPELIAA
jgi:SAM-dependent methyltransferase